MSDLFGYNPAREPVRLIGNQRPSTSETKAQLCEILRRLTRTIPVSVKSGSVNLVRAWRLEREKATKVLSNMRASVNDLEMQIKIMQKWSN